MSFNNLQEVSFLDGRIAAIQTEHGGDKPLSCVLFVHGFLDNANSFSEIIAQMSGYYCVAIDLPGHGKSAHRSADAHYHLSDYVYDLHALISDNQWQQVTLVGHSLGGIISTMLAACFPELIKQVISIESFGPLTEPESTTTQQLRESIVSRHAASKPIKQPESMASIVKARTRVSDLSVVHAEHILNRNTEYKHGQLCWRTDKRLRTKSAMRLTPSQALDLMNNVQCPYHLVLATSGFEKVKALKTKRHSNIDKLQVLELIGGHHVHMEQAKHIVDYLKKCIA